MNDSPDPQPLRRLARAIRRLPRRQRVIFRAIRFQNLTYAEIAERTGYSVAEVETLFAKSLANLTRNLDRKRGQPDFARHSFLPFPHIACAEVPR